MPTDAVRIELLPARLGDCTLVECLRAQRAPRRLLVDAGPPDTWPLRQKLAALAADGQVIDVALVTHIDSDHIGGMVPLLADPATRHARRRLVQRRAAPAEATAKRGVGGGGQPHRGRGRRAAAAVEGGLRCPGRGRR